MLNLIKFFINLTFCKFNKHFLIEIFNTNKDLIFANHIWKTEIYPFQRKMALSWISGYLLYASIPMIIFPILGPENSGRFGMTWTILLGVNSLSMSIISVKIQSYCVLIVQKDFKKLKKEYFNDSLLSFTISFFGILFLFLLLYLCDIYNLEYKNRFLEYKLIMFLSVITLLNQIIFVQAVFVRALKDDPYVISSMIGGILQFILSSFGAYYFGLIGLIWLMLIFALIIGFPWAFYIFWNNRPWEV